MSADHRRLVLDGTCRARDVAIATRSSRPIAVPGMGRSPAVKRWVHRVDLEVGQLP
jgi:hypothetical protein